MQQGQALQAGWPRAEWLTFRWMDPRRATRSEHPQPDPSGKPVWDRVVTTVRTVPYATSRRPLVSRPSCRVPAAAAPQFAARSQDDRGSADALGRTADTAEWLRFCCPFLTHRT